MKLLTKSDYQPNCYFLLVTVDEFIVTSDEIENAYNFSKINKTLKFMLDNIWVKQKLSTVV